MDSKKPPAIGLGYRIGKLTVSSATKERKSNYIVWSCTCDCGGSILLDTRTLQRGTVRDCGCESNVKPGRKDLTGQRFGKLVCLEPVDDLDNSGQTQWLCQCDCGQKCLAATHQLQCGYKKSCGCVGHPPRKDYIGKRFGMLTVVEYAGKRDGMHRWKCVCDCGNETIVGQTLLQTGKTKSCGCLQNSIIKENLKLCEGTSVTILESVGKHLNANNTSGYTGVYWHRKTERWVASITFKGKNYYLGSYVDIQDAVKARKHGEKMHEQFLEWYYKEHKEKESRHKEVK